MSIRWDDLTFRASFRAHPHDTRLQAILLLDHITLSLPRQLSEGKRCREDPRQAALHTDSLVDHTSKLSEQSYREMCLKSRCLTSCALAAVADA
jgi:hypothetical protein